MCLTGRDSIESGQQTSQETRHATSKESHAERSIQYLALRARAFVVGAEEDRGRAHWLFSYKAAFGSQVCDREVEVTHTPMAHKHVSTQAKF